MGRTSFVAGRASWSVAENLHPEATARIDDASLDSVAGRQTDEASMFVLRLRHADHTRHYSICPVGPEGWEVRLVEDRTLRRLSHYRDWHRVERALASFEREVEELTARGWQVASADAG
jgi:hypothetical protein